MGRRKVLDVLTKYVKVALSWFKVLGYSVLHGSDIAPYPDKGETL